MYTINDLYKNDFPGTDEEKLSSQKFKKKKKKPIKRLLKQFDKQFDKQEKCLKKLSKKVKALNEREKAAEVNASNKPKRDEKAKPSFWSRLQDAIIKAVPSVLTRAVTSLVRYLCKGGKLRHSWAVG